MSNTLENSMDKCQRAGCGHSYDDHLALDEKTSCPWCMCTGYRPKLGLRYRLWLWAVNRGLVRT